MDKCSARTRNELGSLSSYTSMLGLMVALLLCQSCTASSADVTDELGRASAPLRTRSEWTALVDHSTFAFHDVGRSDGFVGSNQDGSVTWLVGDWDGDGDDDLVRRTEDGTYNKLLFANNEHRFDGQSPVFLSSAGVVPDTFRGANGIGHRYSWHVADVDGDGRSDVIRRDRDSQDGSKVLMSRYQADGATGYFEVVHGPDVLMGEDGARFTYLVGDFDGDGRDDMVRRDRDGQYNKVLISRGDGTFHASASQLNTGVDGLLGANAGTEFFWLVGDFDGDGRDDLCRRSRSGTGNDVLLSRYSGTTGSFQHFANTDSLTGVQPSARWFVGDLDGDADEDLILRHQSGASNRIGFWQGYRFDLRAPRVASGAAEILSGTDFEWHANDYDGDGRVDLAGRSATHGPVMLLSRHEQEGVSGHFDVVSDVSTIRVRSSGDHTWLPADVNGDGMSDMVLRARLGDSIDDNRVELSLVSEQVGLFLPGDSVVLGFTLPPHVTPILRRYARFRIPSIVTAVDGTLIAFAEGRVEPYGASPRCVGNSLNADSGDIDIVYRTSADGGRTWHPLAVVLNAGCETVGNPTAVVDRGSGKIWLIVSEHAGFRSNWPMPPGERRVWVTSSTDNGQTWATPVHRSGWAPLAQLGVQSGQVRDPGPGCVPSATDEFCVPASAAGYSTNPPALSMFAYRDEAGLEWRWDNPSTGAVEELWPFDAIGPGVGIHAGFGTPRSRLVIPALGRNIVLDAPDLHSTADDWSLEYVDASCSNEGAIVELSTGELLRNERPTSDCQVFGGMNHRSVARDHGIGAWTAFTSDLSLPSPGNGSQASLLRVDDPRGRRVLFMNSASYVNRQHLTVRISYDDHETWTYQRDVNAAHEVQAAGSGTTFGGYSSMTLARQGVVAALCEAADKSPTAEGYIDAILFRRFNLAWVTQGEPDPPE